MYTVKNVKTMQGMEGIAYSCTLYRDGIKIAECIQDGRGGNTNIRFLNRDEEKKLDAHCATLPPCPPFYPGDKPMPMDADMFIAGLVDQIEVNKQLKRWCKTKTVYRIPGRQYKEGEYEVSKTSYSPKVKDFLVGKYGNVEILNEQFV